MVTDMLPYYLANTSASGEGGRSMADNVRAFERANGTTTGIIARPSPAELVRLASEMQGNEERLRYFFGRHSPHLLLTLGMESAAFVRGMTFDQARARGDTLFYGEPVKQTFAGLELRVVHLVHPHMFIKRIVKWTDTHARWCENTGRALIRNGC